MLYNPEALRIVGKIWFRHPPYIYNVSEKSCSEKETQHTIFQGFIFLLQFVNMEWDTF